MCDIPLIIFRYVGYVIAEMEEENIGIVLVEMRRRRRNKYFCKINFIHLRIWSTYTYLTTCMCMAFPLIIFNSNFSLIIACDSHGNRRLYYLFTCICMLDSFKHFLWTGITSSHFGIRSYSNGTNLDLLFCFFCFIGPYEKKTSLNFP